MCHDVDKKKFEDTNEVIRGCKSKDRQYNGETEISKQSSITHYMDT